MLMPIDWSELLRSDSTVDALMGILGERVLSALDHALPLTLAAIALPCFAALMIFSWLLELVRSHGGNTPDALY